MVNIYQRNRILIIAGPKQGVKQKVIKYLWRHTLNASPLRTFSVWVEPLPPKQKRYKNHVEINHVAVDKHCFCPGDQQQQPHDRQQQCFLSSKI